MVKKMRLIDADALIEMCKRQAKDSWNQYARPYAWGTVYDTFVDYLEDAPTIESESLRPKGEWIDGQCSNCGYQAKSREIVPHWDGGFITIYVKDNFCHHCGADMRGGADGDTDTRCTLP